MEESTSCKPCSPGHLTASTASSSEDECYPCPADTFADALSGECVPCAPGTTSAPASLDCNPVPPGYYNDGTGLKICGLGTSSELQFGSTTCVECQLGSYSRNLGEAECTLCGIGTYADEVGSTECKVCPEGTAAIDYGATSLDECERLPKLVQYSSAIFDEATCDELLIADLVGTDLDDTQLARTLEIRQNQVGGTWLFPMKGDPNVI